MATQEQKSASEAGSATWLELAVMFPLGAGAVLAALGLLGLLAPLAGTTILARGALVGGFCLAVWLGNRYLSGGAGVPLLGAACFMLAAPWLVPVLRPLVGLSAKAGEPAIGFVFRILFSLPALILPGICLGVALGRLGDGGRAAGGNWRLAALQCASLFAGAAFGAVLGAAPLLPRFGEQGVALAAGGFLFLAAVLSGALRRAAPGAAFADVGARQPGVILLGALSLSCIFCWERFLSQLHGPFPELPFRVLALAFSCAALGSILLALWPASSASPLRIPLLAALAGIGVALPLSWLDRLPLLYLSAWKAAPLESLSFALRTWGIGALLIAPAGVAIGALLPMLISRPEAPQARPDSGNGAAGWPAALAGGGLLGAAVSAFWGLPGIGYERYLCSLAGFFLGYSAWEFARAVDAWRWGRIAGILACFAGTLGIAWRLPAADTKLLSTGVYRYAPEILKQFGSAEAYRDKRRQADVPFYREGGEFTVAVESVVADQDAIRAITLDGTVAATTYYDLIPQILAAEIPMLLHSAPETVFLAGYGTGIPAGSLLLHALRHLDVAEVEPAVVAASRQFEPGNRAPRSDPRLRLLITDARQALLSRPPATYDAILLRPGSPEAGGARFLTTREFYRLAASRLRQGGLLAQAVPLQGLGLAEVASLVKTLQASFKDVVVMQTYYEEILLLASDEPLRFDLGVMSRVLGDDKVRSDLARIGIANPESVMIRYRLSGQGAEIFAQGARVLRDRAAPLPWSAFRPGGRPDPVAILETMDRTSTGLAERIAGIPDGDAGSEALARVARAALASRDAVRAADLAEALLARGAVADGHQLLGDACYLRQEQILAVDEWHKALAADPEHGAALFSLARFNSDRLNFPEAEAYLSRILEVNPRDPAALFSRGRARYQQKKLREAEDDLAQALAIGGESDVPLALYYLGMIQKDKGNLGGSAEFLRRYLEWGYTQDRLTPVEADVHLALAEVYKGLNLPDLSEQQRLAGEALKTRLKKAADAQREAVFEFLTKP